MNAKQIVEFCSSKIGRFVEYYWWNFNEDFHWLNINLHNKEIY
jgi:hypothetical protein